MVWTYIIHIDVLKDANIGMLTTVKGYNLQQNVGNHPLPGIPKIDLSFIDIYSQDLKDDIKARRKFRKNIVNRRFGNASKFCKNL